MERIILLLIEDDIKLERQYWMLQQIGWTTETLVIKNLKVISLLLNFELTDDVIESYSKMQEKAFKLDIDDKEIEELAKEIYVFLNGLNKI